MLSRRLVGAAALVAAHSVSLPLLGSVALAGPVAPADKPWDAGDGFSFDAQAKKFRRSVSGLACVVVDKQHHCIVAFDEGAQARTVVLREGAYAIGTERVALLPSAGQDVELDAEAAATDGQFVFVAGSHSVKRDGCDSNPNSRHVVRFRIDPATGQVLRNPPNDPKGALVDYADSQRLWSIMESLPDLKDFVGKCLDEHGVNIEGMAEKAGRLYFGFRGPAEDGEAKILSVDTKALFEGGDAHPTVTRLRVHKGRGIRDLAAVNDGILILAGPDDAKDDAGVGWAVALWDARDTAEGVVVPTPLGELDLGGVKLRSCDKEIKPEAMAVTVDAATAYRIVIMSDGMCDGGPMTFDVKRGG